jgi:hypothetical protein
VFVGGLRGESSTVFILDLFLHLCSIFDSVLTEHRVMNIDPTIKKKLN